MKRFVFLICIISVLLSCTTTSVADISRNPQRFKGRNVNIKVSIDQRISIPFSDFHFYVVEDDASKALLLSINDYETRKAFTLQVKVAALESGSVDPDSKKYIRDFLLKNNLLASETAETVSSTIIEIANRLLRGIGNLFLLIEQ